MIIEVGLLLVFGVLFFHMRVLGSVASIALIAGLGSLTFGGVGLLTASRAQKIESVSGLINLVMMPMWIFSGVFFSYERFPAVIHPLIKALPLTALNDALRASILEGTPLLHQWPRLLVMVLWGGISFRAGAEVVSLDLESRLCSAYRVPLRPRSHIFGRSYERGRLRCLRNNCSYDLTSLALVSALLPSVVVAPRRSACGLPCSRYVLSS